MTVQFGDAVFGSASPSARMPAPTRPEQIGRLQVFLDEKALNQKTDILSGFDLGQMAAKELGVGEQDFANHLSSLQRFVEERFDRI